MKPFLAAAVLTMLAVLLPVGSATAGEVREQDGVILPVGLAKDAVVPVLVCHESVLERDWIDWKRLVGGDGIAFPAKGAIVVVAKGRATRRRAGARDVQTEEPDEIRDIENALSRAARLHPGLARCPWVVAIASQASAASERLLADVLKSKGRFQGLVLAQPYPHALAPMPEPMTGFRLGVVERGTQGESLLAAAKEKGAAVQHAGLGDDFPKGVTLEVASFLQQLDKKPVEERPVVPAAAEPGTWTTLTTKSTDDLEMTADLYRNADPHAPVLVCAHQAGSSRGEYRRIAPRLVAEGYTVLAIDQRSGGAFDGVANETAARAKEQGVSASYLEAQGEMRRAVAWARELGFDGPIALVGSSYSATNAVWVAPDLQDVVAVVAFSPGPYVHPRYRKLFDEDVTKLTKPTLFVCPPSEEENAKKLLDQIPAKAKEIYVQPDGVHGAKTLFLSPTFGDAWTHVLAFLHQHVHS